MVAPDRERSAVGHALTLHRPLRVHQLGPRRLAVNGTPTDCVNLAVLGIPARPPRVVVSGINAGANLGDDVTYSGTVSAAMEGRLLGVPALAISLVRGTGGDLRPGRTERAPLAHAAAPRTAVEPPLLLNVNVPAGTAAGIRITRLGRRVYSEKVVDQQ